MCLEKTEVQHQYESSAQNGKIGCEGEKPSLLYDPSCEGRDDKCASLALLPVFLYSVAHCQI